MRITYKKKLPKVVNFAHIPVGSVFTSIPEEESLLYIKISSPGTAIDLDSGQLFYFKTDVECVIKQVELIVE